MTIQTLRPADGRRVRKPDGQLLKDEGEPIEIDTFWRRRLDDQDVTATDDTTEATAPAKRK
ncbi:DUF2635 domain-containing protein [Sphingomonas paucimobilis]|uniref:DUF2635 domain-containing protein n=1 Tax=Sphingomonas paucimobilis TaxID=13689 RepID=A0A7T3A9B2_SPHPI|nr:DUF2635 domain-containing protein [Sphingomonas paucimobilis]QPT08584.1 DUF2635 domain-containing protein [Sphingomonas paucimobilis]